MKIALRLTVPVAVALAIAAPALAMQGVSPGAVEQMVQVNDPCPTFSWVLEGGALGYELVTHALPEDPAEPVELTAETEVLYVAIPAGATSWTPSAEQCVAPGGRYVWFVRAVTGLAGDEVVEAGEWSEGRYFRVPAGPSDYEVARAVKVLKRWEAANAGGMSGLSAAAEAGTGTAAKTVSGTDAGPSVPKSVPTASAAIRGDNPETDVEAYGVIGVSASVFGAGVAAANTEGGPDLVLDGSYDGATDTVFGEWGIARTSGSNEHFRIANNGGGGMTLDVVGTVAATGLECPECIGPSQIADEAVTSAAIEDDGVTETDIAPGAVNSTHIFDSSIQAADLAADSVTGAAITDGSITTPDLANGAVSSSKLATAAVTTAKLDDGAVTADKIANGAVAASQIAPGSIGGTELADEAVTSSKIAPGAVGSSSLANGSVTGAKLADGSVGSGALRSNAVTVDKISDDAVTGVEILDGSVTMVDLASESVGSDEIEDGGVQAGDIGASAIATGHLMPDAVTSDKIAPGAVETADLHESSVNTLKIQDGTILAADLADGAVTGAKIADGGITAADVDPTGGIYASKTAVYSVVDSTSVNPGTCTAPEAECNDSNDLPLAGTCNQGGSGLPTQIMEWAAYHWDDPSQPARWRCEICYEPTGPGPLEISATILCVAVPGP